MNSIIDRRPRRFLPRRVGSFLGLGVAWVFGVFAGGSAMAQMNIKVPGVDVSMGSGSGNNMSISIGGKNSVGNVAGSIDDNADVEGVSVVNGEVTIDGEKVPKGKTRHTGKKSGTKYVIKWGKDGNVAISQE